MSIRWMPVTATLLLIPLLALGEDPPSIERIDVQRLQTAGLKPDPQSLVALVRPTPPEALARIPGLLRDLEEDDFERRHLAGEQLSRLGRPAREALSRLPAETSLDLQRQARQLIEEIDNQLASTTTLAVLRTLCRKNHPDAAELLLEHLPYFAATQGADLLAVLLQVDPTSPEADRALRQALRDASAQRRAAAGLLLARSGSTQQLEATLPLLSDENPTVRFRIAQGLIGRDDERGLAPLVALLSVSSTQGWQAEELLRWVAGDSAPEALLGHGDAGKRKTCQAAWEQWLARSDRKIDWVALKQAPRRPGLFLLCRQDRVEMIGSDGSSRFLFQTPEGGNYTDAHLLPDGRLLTFDDNEAEVRMYDLAGKVLWKWRAPGGEIALTLQPLLEENRVLVVTDEQLHELALTGKHQRTLRLGEKFFSDACLIDANRILALTDEGFFVVDRTTGGILNEVQVPNRNDLFDSGKLWPLPEGLVAVHSLRVDNVILVDPAGRVTTAGPAAKPLQVWGLARYRWGNWIISGGGSNRLAEHTHDGRVVREVVLANRPTRFRPVLEELRLGLDDSLPAPFNIDSVSYRIASLKSADPVVRRRAATLLGQYREQASLVIPALVQAFDGDDDVTRVNVARSLAQLGAVALPSLRDVLRRGRSEARVQAAIGIGLLGVAAEPALPDLVEQVRERSVALDLRRACCDAIAQLGPRADSASPTLRTTLTDLDAPLRQRAALALGQIAGEDPLTVKTLIAALEDREESVAVAAALSLGRFGPASAPAVPVMVRLLKRPASTQAKSPVPLAVRTQIVATLGTLNHISAEAVPVLSDCLADKDEDRELRANCIRALAQIGPAARDVMPLLSEILLSDQGQPLHSETFRALIQLRRLGGVSVLMKAARSGSDSVRYTAVTSLGSLGADAHPAVPLLKELDTTEKNLRVRSAIQRALRRLPNLPAA